MDGKNRKKSDHDNGSTAMGFRRQDLQEAFFVPGSHAFRVYGYGTADGLQAVLESGYFGAARSQLRPGELIFVSAGAGPERGRSNAGSGPVGEARSALLMVSQNTRGVPVLVRLVQDFGGPEDPAAGPFPGWESPETAEPSPSTPRRGRPPGSRNKKPT